MPECDARRRELERRARARQTEARRHVTPYAGEPTVGWNRLQWRPLSGRSRLGPVRGAEDPFSASGHPAQVPSPLKVPCSLRLLAAILVLGT